MVARLSGRGQRLVEIKGDQHLLVEAVFTLANAHHKRASLAALRLKHANMLEWVIIVLIILEVFFQIVQLVLPAIHGDAYGD